MEMEHCHKLEDEKRWRWDSVDFLKMREKIEVTLHLLHISNNRITDLLLLLVLFRGELLQHVRARISYPQLRGRHAPV